MSDAPETDLKDDLYLDCDDSCCAVRVIWSSTGEEFTGDIVPAEFARRLERERDELRKIIANFCEQNDWAVDAWKNQDHIKPLFDIHAKTKEGK
jgi:hypothetical protein